MVAASDENNVTVIPESKTEAEALLPLFHLIRILSQDQHGRRINIFGTINDQDAVLTLERAAFPSDSVTIEKFLENLASTTNLGANDIYRWYMSNSISSSHPNLKINLIWPCTENHIRKYTTQRVHYVTEGPEVYRDFIKPWIEKTQRTQKRVGWIHNILDGITEQEDIVYRSEGFGIYQNQDRSDSLGFLLLPDLNWDRRSVEGLHLLALVERRDLWSLRSLRKRDADWLIKVNHEALLAAAKEATKLVKSGHGEVVDMDQFKCYVHYQPTYYHFHIHVVHVMLEAGATQAVGKAFSLELLVSMLTNMNRDEQGMEDISMSYTLGEESELWKNCFSALKKGNTVSLIDH